jgi:hypothetical protein
MKKQNLPERDPIVSEIAAGHLVLAQAVARIARLQVAAGRFMLTLPNVPDSAEKDQLAGDLVLLELTADRLASVAASMMPQEEK